MKQVKRKIEEPLIGLWNKAMLERKVNVEHNVKDYVWLEIYRALDNLNWNHDETS